VPPPSTYAHADGHKQQDHITKERRVTLIRSRGVAIVGILHAATPERLVVGLCATRLTDLHRPEYSDPREAMELVQTCGDALAVDRSARLWGKSAKPTEIWSTSETSS
jgi:hypothetical protein